MEALSDLLKISVSLIQDLFINLYIYFRTGQYSQSVNDEVGLLWINAL